MLRRPGTLLLTLLLAVLTACQPLVAPDSPDAAPPSHQSHQLVLALQAGMSVYTQTAANIFSDKVAELSEQALTVKVEESADALAAFDRGADLMFAPNATIARANGDFASYTSPFYFHDYKHMSLTLNNDSFHELVGEATSSLLGGRSLAAFYDGGSAIVSMTGRMFDTVDQYETMELSCREDGLLADAFAGFGAEVSQYGLDRRLLGFDRGSEPTVEMDLLDLPRLAISPERENLNICLSYHHIEINWLMLSDESGATLSERERAVLLEAAAWAVSQSDERLLADEQAAIDLMEQKGGNLTTLSHSEFSEAVDAVLTLDPRYNNLWDWELHREVRDLAQY